MNAVSSLQARKALNVVQPKLVEHKKMHDFVMVVERAHHAIDNTHHFLEQTAKSSALRAFRATEPASKLNKLPIPVLNKAGNLRGIVLSKNARTIYNISFKYAEKIAKYERAMLAASVLIEVAKDGPKYAALWGGRAPLSQKSLQTAVLIGSDVAKGLTGVVPVATHLVAKSLEGYIGLGKIVGIPGAETAVKNVQKVDHWVSTTYDEILDPNNMHQFGVNSINYIQMHVGFH